VRMYTTSSIAPVFIVHHLVKAGLIAQGAKLILVSSESGSITLRHEKEGGGNYGHHASKAASNMVGKLLSLDLKERGIAVAIVHVCCFLSLAYCGNTLVTDAFASPASCVRK
jgi:NAD(P)-dependent dehydrogenase (short-subunit alcohol dehydrogenase family)